MQSRSRHSAIQPRSFTPKVSFDRISISLGHTKEEYMGKLEGKIALVTGGNSGIGLATARQFVREGAYVFITGRRDAELATAAREIGRNVTGVQGDVANVADLDRLFAQIKREKGKLGLRMPVLPAMRPWALSARSFSIRFSTPT